MPISRWINLRKFFTLAQISPKRCQITILSSYPPKEKMLRIVIWHLFWGDLCQSEKLSEIRPHLRTYHVVSWWQFMKTQENKDMITTSETISSHWNNTATVVLMAKGEKERNGRFISPIAFLYVLKSKWEFCFTAYWSCSFLLQTYIQGSRVGIWTAHCEIAEICSHGIFLGYFLMFLSFSWYCFSLYLSLQNSEKL